MPRQEIFINLKILDSLKLCWIERVKKIDFEVILDVKNIENARLHNSRII